MYFYLSAYPGPATDIPPPAHGQLFGQLPGLLPGHRLQEYTFITDYCLKVVCHKMIELGFFLIIFHA